MSDLHRVIVTRTFQTTVYVRADNADAAMADALELSDIKDPSCDWWEAMPETAACVVDEVALNSRFGKVWSGGPDGDWEAES